MRGMPICAIYWRGYITYAGHNYKTYYSLLTITSNWTELFWMCILYLSYNINGNDRLAYGSAWNNKIKCKEKMMKRREERKNNQRTIELKLPYFLLNDDERSQHSRQLFSITSDMRKHIKSIAIQQPTVFLLHSFYPTYSFDRSHRKWSINDQVVCASVTWWTSAAYEHIAYLNAFSIQYLLAYFHCLL